MKYLFLLLALIILFIIGEQLGLLMQCENCSQLRAAKRFIWCVPVIQTEVFILILFDALKNKRFKLLVAFFRIGQTGLIILSSISHEVEAIKAETKSRPKNSMPIIRNTPERARTAIKACA